jgi:hypothetical protein
MRKIWFKPAPHGDISPIRTPGSIAPALGITGIATMLLGVLPGIAMHFGVIARITGAFGG